MTENNPNVKIYSGRACSYCNAAKRLLDKKGVAYTELNVDEDPALRTEMEELSKRQSVPQIFIDDFHVGGFDDMVELQRAGKLDDLLNPS